MLKRLGISGLIFAVLIFVTTAKAQPTQDSNAIDEQLQINKEAFLRGSTEQIRITAAGLLLENQNPQAMKILIESLDDVNNSSARLALHKAIASDSQLNINEKEQLIEPLLRSLSRARDAEVRMVSEALLVFKYEQIEPSLRGIISEASLPVESRLNAVFALRLQRDMRAIIWLIKLLGDSEPKIVEAASEALNSLGIPAVGKDALTKRQMIEEIQRIGKDEFLRYWEIRQGYEKQIASLREQRDWWKQKYLSSLDELYSALGSDESARIKFLTSRLSSTEADVRLWAISKVTQWWVGTEPKTRLLAEIGTNLIKLISDQNREVRFNTAKLVALMGELDSAQVLLEQVKQEQDDAVRTEQFIALGQACRYAFSAKSPIMLDGEIRKQTLDLAVEFLDSNEPFKAQKGVEVIRNLLEFNGLPEEQAVIYIEALAKKYEQNIQSVSLNSELLNAMAVLCRQGSYKNHAVKLYERFFIQSLSSESDLIREAAVNGLINIDKSAALRRLRNDFVNDKNINIRRQLLSLAEEVGTILDLDWLALKINTNSEGSAAWKAVLSILEDSGAAVVNDWMLKFEEQGLTGTRMISVLGIAERKAAAETKTEMRKAVQYKLVKQFIETQDMTRAAEYLGTLLKDETDQNKRRQFRAELMSVYLEAGNIKAACLLVTNRLLEADISNESPIAKVIESYIKNPNGKIEPNLLIDELSRIDISTVPNRPKWKVLLAEWKKLIEIAAQELSVADSNQQN